MSESTLIVITVVEIVVLIAGLAFFLIWIGSLLGTIATTLETVCVDTVEKGFMTKDLALLVGPDQKWLSTTGFLDKVDAHLKAAMA